VGALDNDQKGQEFVIEVARSFAVSRPDVCFMLVGSGRDETMLKALAGNLRNVVFTGFVENVGDFLAASDIFVLPSRREGIGSILLDAMDFGLPIVATRVGGVPAIVRDDENGILIEACDTVGLGHAIERLLDSEALRRRLGERGREVSSTYSADVMAEKYLELYRDATAGSRAER
jgi:glycosyltransferase involved in cell wall biosynthesis